MDQSDVERVLKELVPHQDVSKASDEDVRTMNQLVWLKTHTSWIDFCVDKATPKKPWWVTVQLMGQSINVLLSKELLYRRRIGKSPEPVDHRDVFMIGGLTGLCELASGSFDKPLPVGHTVTL